MSARIGHLPGADAVVRRAMVAPDLTGIGQAVGAEAAVAGGYSKETAEAVARAARERAGVSHALAVLIDLDAGNDRIDFGGTVYLAIATAGGVVSRRSRLVGGREWVRLGAAELGLDCLRRHLLRLPVVERIDFEKVEGTPAATPSKP